MSEALNAFGLAEGAHSNVHGSSTLENKHKNHHQSTNISLGNVIQLMKLGREPI